MTLDFLQDLVVVTGHYGSGKTNLSVNLALMLRAQGREVALADLDVVNPYFRTADFGEISQEKGIELILPHYAGSSLDIPSLNARLDAALRGGGTLIIDVGGDDAGAYALGRYSAEIARRPHTVLYVVNRYRHIGGETAEAVRLVGDIQGASRLAITHIVNNSNLGPETKVDEVLASREFADSVAGQTGKPVAFTSLMRSLYEQIPPDCRDGLLAVDRLVRLPWEG